MRGHIHFIGLFGKYNSCKAGSDISNDINLKPFDVLVRRTSVTLDDC